MGLLQNHDDTSPQMYNMGMIGPLFICLLFKKKLRDSKSNV